MSVRELVLDTSDGGVTTFALTESTLSICSQATPFGTFKKRSFLFSSCASASPFEIPVSNVIAVTLSGLTVEVSYVTRNYKQRLRMKQLRGNVSERDASLAKDWCSSLTRMAYKDSVPAKVLKVFINPYSGPGKARQIFSRKVEPILRAAGCTLDVTFTTRTGHAMEIAQNIELTYDALVVVSGDGLIHEIMNGLAKHATPEKAFSIPIAPIPAGSGNGLSLNILGLHDGLDPCAAALNILKGQPMKIDLFSFTQGNQKRISFMSQSVGLSADVDIESEQFRWMGDFRFVVGFLRRVVTPTICKMELMMKVVEQDKSKMVDNLYARRKSAAKCVPPVLPVHDITSSDEKVDENTGSEGNWVKFDKPALCMLAGKGPYVNRSLMQFPVSHPDDGLIDVSIHEIVGRRLMLEAMMGAELGRSYWLTSNRYFKVSAYHAKPLTPGGVLVVDGEAFPFEEFQIEVLHRLGTLLSPYPYYAPEFKAIDTKGTTRGTKS